MYIPFKSGHAPSTITNYVTRIKKMVSRMLISVILYDHRESIYKQNSVSTHDFQMIMVVEADNKIYEVQELWFWKGITL